MMIQSDNSMFVSKCAFVDGDDLWMLTNETNILCRFDFRKMELQDYYVIPVRKITSNEHLSVCKGNNHVFVLPYLGTDMYVLDINTGQLEKEALPFSEEEKTKLGKLIISVFYNGKLYILGHSVKGIFCYNPEHNSWTGSSYAYLEDIKNEGIDIEKPFLNDCFYMSEGNLYTPIDKTNLFIRFDLNSLSHDILKINGNYRLRTIDCIDGEKFLFSTYDEERIVWSFSKGIEDERCLNVTDVEEKAFMRVFFRNGKFYYISANERRVFVETNGEIQELFFDYEDNDIFPVGLTQFEAIFINEENIYFQARYNGQLFYIDTMDDSIHKLNIAVNKEKKAEVYSSFYRNLHNRIVITENNIFGLGDFIRITQGI
ncbi:MAG: hypothetical protein E7298_00525 [Lachnospiraceae bacterium]|nr:hypothetical protein [Lachnospiraceae bacterium]